MSDYDRHIPQTSPRKVLEQKFNKVEEAMNWTIDPANLVEVTPAKPATTQSIKHDQGKPDLSMTSYELMEAIARVREFGAKKYSRDNWKISGFQVTRSCAAALRHIFLFLGGETLDQESGLSHLAHAVCCLEHAIYDMKNHPENDDRYKGGK